MSRKKFTVIWDDELIADVATYWQASGSYLRRELTRACDEIDRTLASAPESVGRPFHPEPGSLVWSLPDYAVAVAVVYRIVPDDRIVKLSRIVMADH